MRINCCMFILRCFMFILRNTKTTFDNHRPPYYDTLKSKSQAISRKKV